MNLRIKRLKTLWISCLALIAFASICSAQSVRIVEKLADGSYVVLIDGTEFRALSGDKLIGLAKQKLDLETVQKVNAELTGQIKEALLERDLAKANQSLVQQKADSFEADFKRSQEDAKRNYGLFIGERTLRQEVNQFIPKGNAHGFWGKTLDFLNSQQAQVGFKLVIPTAQAIKVFSARCSR